MWLRDSCDFQEHNQRLPRREHIWGLEQGVLCRQGSSAGLAPYVTLLSQGQEVLDPTLIQPTELCLQDQR